MKIGILTLPFNNNYGGYLQAYALMTVLKDMGHEVELIYRRHNRRPFLYRIKYSIKTIIKIVLGMNHGPLIANQEEEHRKKGELMMPFVDKYISPKTKPLFSTSELRNECRGKYDAIIVGSDQVWRPDYVPNIQNFFLDFVDDEKVVKIVYAASFGNNNPSYTLKQKQECGRLIELFDKVSVREDNGVEVILNFGWKVKTTPSIVLDPTMLLCKTHYESLLSSENIKNRYLLSYVLDNNIELKRLVDSLCSKLNLNEYSVIDPRKWERPDYKMPSIETWLESIMNAEFVITDSFHGTVFSIIFNKPFVVYANKYRGAERFYTLLRYFGLENRIINESNCNDEMINLVINWDNVNKLLEKEKTKSIEFISELLEN